MTAVGPRPIRNDWIKLMNKLRSDAIHAANQGRFADAIKILGGSEGNPSDDLSCEILRVELLSRESGNLAKLDRLFAASPDFQDAAIMSARVLFSRQQMQECCDRYELATSSAELPTTDCLLRSIAREYVSEFKGHMATVGDADVARKALAWARREGLGEMVAVQALVDSFLHPAELGKCIEKLSNDRVFDVEQFAKSYSDRSERYRVLDALAYVESYRCSKRTAVLLCRRLEARKDYKAALVRLERYGEPAKDDYDHNSMLGSLYDRVKAGERALPYLNKALSLRPSNEALLDRVLRLEYDSLKKAPLRSTSAFDRHLKKKLENCQRKLAQAPKEIGARHNLARALMYAEDFKAAEHILAALRNEDRTNPAILWDYIRARKHRKTDPREILGLATDMISFETSHRVRHLHSEALRDTGDFEAALFALGDNWNTHESTAFEYVRTLFFAGKFREAEDLARELCAIFPGALKFPLLLAAALVEQGRAGEVALEAFPPAQEGERHLSLELPLIKCAVVREVDSFETSLACLDPIFGEMGVQCVRSSSNGSVFEFDRLLGVGTYPREPEFSGVLDNGPLVSVIMTTYNVGPFVKTAVHSILRQSYKNLELLIVDDCSSDETRSVLREIQETDSRVKLIFKTTNDGTYVSKNIGILHSRGEYIALQDSDDWSHPDRIAVSVQALLTRSKLIGLTTDWFRMSSDGKIVIKAGGQVSHGCCISLVFRRAAIEKLGFFDSVRIAADLEYIERMTLSYGPLSVARLRMPLLFGRARSGSLTASEEFGITRTGFTEPRQLYHFNSRQYHDRISSGESSFMPFPLIERRFNAPEIILP
jgi:Flp pilus assembly protein TadD